MPEVAHMRSTVSAVDRPDGLPIGTRVLKPGIPGRSIPRYGTVMYHEPEYSRGCFPVRFDDGLSWETCDASDVTAVEDTDAIRSARTTSARTTRRVAS